MQVSLKYAEEHLADLASAAYRGEEVEIAQPGQSPLRLVLAEPVPAKEQSTSTGKRILGAGVGELRVPSFEEWQAMDADLGDLPLMSSGEV